jgi:hypothetical protein
MSASHGVRPIAYAGADADADTPMCIALSICGSVCGMGWKEERKMCPRKAEEVKWECVFFGPDQGVWVEAGSEVCAGLGVNVCVGGCGCVVYCVYVLRMHDLSSIGEGCLQN